MSTLQIDGLINTFTAGETPYDVPMNANWKAIGWLLTGRMDDLNVNTPPGSPATGYRCIVGTSPTGALAANAKNLARWNGSSYDFLAPVDGMQVMWKDLKFVYDGAITKWRQVGVGVLAVITANVVADSGHLVKNIFGSATAVPAKSLGAGTTFSWKFKQTMQDAGSDDAAAKYEMLIGSTSVGDVTLAAFAEYNGTKATSSGEMVVRSAGASGSVMGSMEYFLYNASALAAEFAYISATPTTADTTGTGGPDLKITLSSISNSPVRTVVEGEMKVSGLVLS